MPADERMEAAGTLVAIPSFNRARLLDRAIAAAFAQSEPVSVAVVDDGSTDETPAVVKRWAAHPRFGHVRLARNQGTAVAKNVALALFPFHAISFHDSDDIPERDKLARQARVLARRGVPLDPCLPWAQAGAGHAHPEGTAEIGAVLTAHWLIDSWGGRHRVARTLSLVEDMFPHLQFGAGPPGDWVLINSALFARSAFRRVGGYDRSLEEDRELRNRLLMHGVNLWFLDEPLLTKFESEDSLTTGVETGYRSARREADRRALWDRLDAWRHGGSPPVVPIDLEAVELEAVAGLGWRPADDLPMTDGTRRMLNAWHLGRQE